MKIIKKNQLEVRPASEKDREAIFAFCKNTWDDRTDYIERLWDEWFEDSQGRIFVALLDQIPVGMARVSIISKSEVWWEGLRVDRTYRRLGIGSALDLKREQFGIENQIKTSRTCVVSDNLIRNKMLAKQGRKKVATFICYRSTSIDPNNRSDLPSLVELKFQDFKFIWKLFNKSKKLNHNNYLYVSKGANKWQEITFELLQECLKNNLIIGYKENNELVNFALVSKSQNYKKIFAIGYVGGNFETLPLLLLGLRQLAFTKEYLYAGGFFPIYNDISNALEKADYQKISDLGEINIYEWSNF